MVTEPSSFVHCKAGKVAVPDQMHHEIDVCAQLIMVYVQVRDKTPNIVQFFGISRHLISHTDSIVAVFIAKSYILCYVYSNICITVFEGPLVDGEDFHEN